MENLTYPAGRNGSQFLESALDVPWNLHDQFDDGGSLFHPANEAYLAQMVHQSPAPPAIPTSGLDTWEFGENDSVRITK
jgi:hypothetical protein